MKKLPLLGIQNLLQQLRPGNKVLAIEISGDKMIGAVAEKKGKRAEVLNFVMIDRTNPKDDLPEPANIQEILDRLDYHIGSAILVSPMARSVQISMNRAKLDKLRHYQLCDALRWEVEPYTGISGVQALIGAEKGSTSEREELMILTEDDEEIDVNVTAIESNVFRAMKQIFKRCGLKLVRIYPPEVCFFMHLLQGGGEEAQAVLDIGADYGNFTVVRGNQPTQINTYPLGKDVLLDLIDGGDTGEAEQALAFLLKQAPEPLPLILTGIGATVLKIVEYLNGRSPVGARSLDLSRSDKLGRSEHEGVNALYAVAAGAALRELSGRRFRSIGITDAIPPIVRLKRSVYMMPLGVTVLLATGLFLHYGYMKNRKGHYIKQTTELTTQIKEKKQKFDAHKKLESDLKEMKDKIQLTQRQIAFLKGGSDNNLAHIGKVLQAFLTLPGELQLEGITQKGFDYSVKGNADQYQKVGQYAVTLQKEPWCRSVKIEQLEQKNDGKEGGGHLHFLMQMDTMPEEQSSTAAKP